MTAGGIRERSPLLELQRHLGGQLSWTLLARKICGALAIWRAGGWAALRARLFPRSFAADYQRWISLYDSWNPSRAIKCEQVLSRCAYRPLISIVVPVYNVDERFLRVAIDSVCNQVYPNWELILVDDCSTAAHVPRVLAEYAARDTRIKTLRTAENSHIVRATNQGIEAATGEFIAFLDNDDELTPDALACVVVELNQSSEAVLVYSDEDKLTSQGQRCSPYFKSDWNPELIRYQNFVCHFTVVRRSKLAEVGGLRVGYEGAQDWDLVLRIADSLPRAELTKQIRHIPHVLYHWRMIAGSTASALSEKPYVLEAQRRAVDDHLKRQGLAAHGLGVDANTGQVRFELVFPQPPPHVAIIIPTRDRLALVKQCVESILTRSTYSNFSIIIVDNGSVESATLDWFRAITAQDARVAVMRDEAPFNYSRLNNRAVAQTKAPFVLLCNNDIEVVTSNWIERLLGFAALEGVGAVGARLLFPNQTVQHAGVVTGLGGVAGHPLRYAARWERGYFDSLILSRTVSACTAACLLVRRELYQAVGGMDERELAVAFNDVDLCLKIEAAGCRVVYCAEAELLHHESASRGQENTVAKIERFESEVRAMKGRWGERLIKDPFYNPNLTLHTEGCTFSYPPRVVRPW